MERRRRFIKQKHQDGPPWKCQVLLQASLPSVEWWLKRCFTQLSFDHKSIAWVCLPTWATSPYFDGDSASSFWRTSSSCFFHWLTVDLLILNSLAAAGSLRVADSLQFRLCFVSVSLHRRHFQRPFAKPMLFSIMHFICAGGMPLTSFFTPTLSPLTFSYWPL